MLPRLRRLALLLPILLLGLVLLSWARSYLPDQTYFRTHQGRLLIFFISGGSPPTESSETLVDYSRRIAQVQSRPSLQFLGFEWTDLVFKSSYPGFIAIPFWFIAAVLAVFSLWAILRLRSQRARFLPGHCRSCGYDLRGSNGKCPECGQEVPRPLRTTSTAAVG